MFLGLPICTNKEIIGHGNTDHGIKRRRIDGDTVEDEGLLVVGAYAAPHS